MKTISLTKKTLGIAIALAAGSFAAGMGVVHATQSPDQITVDEALSIALKDAGRGAEEVTVTKQRPDVEDGIQTYDIEFYYFEGDSSVTEYDYEIEAATGRILERSRETEYVTRTPQKQVPAMAGTADSGTQEKDAGNGDTVQQQKPDVQPAQQAPQVTQPAQQPQTTPQPVQPQPAQTPQASDIGPEQAKAIALAHAGAGADVPVTKAKQDFEDGRVVYEIEFYIGYVEYEYEIDAATGAILDFDIDYDD